MRTLTIIKEYADTLHHLIPFSLHEVKNRRKLMGELEDTKLAIDRVLTINDDDDVPF